MTNPRVQKVSTALKLAHFANLPTKAPAKAVRVKTVAATRPEVDDDPDQEMSGSSQVAAARRRERARCAAILGHPDAASNMVMAANLAFKTRLTRAQALGMLTDSVVGLANATPSAQADASSWDRAFAAVRPAPK